MTTAQAIAAWDLSDLFAGIDDPEIQHTIDTTQERAIQFESAYKGRIAKEDCNGALLADALRAYEQILRVGVKPICYAHLVFNADTSVQANGAFLQKMQESMTEWNQRLLFLDLEVGAMPELAFASARNSTGVEPYRHYIDAVRRNARHYLSEPEEKLAEELANTGTRAFQRLFEEITSRAIYRVDLQNGIEEMNESRAFALLHSDDRAVRKAAADAVTHTLKENAHALTFVFNNQLAYKSTMDRLRGYAAPETARHESNELEPSVVATVVQSVEAGKAMVNTYYKLKGELLGIDKLMAYDRYAPIKARESDVPYEDAQGVVLEAFGDFSAQMRDVAAPFFASNWIDAAPRQGKSGGAFCMSPTPDLHPYVFMSYTGKPGDVMTLAHELGHAVHGCLARGNHYLDYDPSLPLAETASTFAEMLVFDRLMARLTTNGERLALLCSKIEETFATVFRQVAMYRFEQAAHAHRREAGEAPTERYNQLWLEHMQPMFGDSLTLDEEHGWWWLYISHVYTVPFYVYAYAFGELLVLSLYARYREEGEPFVEKYLDLLRAGGSMTPQRMVEKLGIDIRDRGFWDGGIAIIGAMVTQAVTLAAQAASETDVAVA